MTKSTISKTSEANVSIDAVKFDCALTSGVTAYSALTDSLEDKNYAFHITSPNPAIS